VAVSHLQPLGIDVERVRSDFGGEEVAQANFAPADSANFCRFPRTFAPGILQLLDAQRGLRQSTRRSLQIPLAVLKFTSPGGSAAILGVGRGGTGICFHFAEPKASKPRPHTAVPKPRAVLRIF